MPKTLLQQLRKSLVLSRQVAKIYETNITAEFFVFDGVEVDR